MPLFDRVLKINPAVHAILAAAAFVGLGQVKKLLDASYAASKHPVDFMTGQTGFSGELVKSYYAHMESVGTLGIYVKTQIIDFGFIAMVALCGLFIGTLVARFGVTGGWSRKLGLAAAGAVIVGATFDALENLVSFVMLSNPQDFANWIALPYSGFAVAKFVFLTLGMAMVLLSLAFNLGERWWFRQRHDVA